MHMYYAVMLFILGTILGSFYNVVGERLPLGKSINKPGSHCAKCNHRLGPLELIPILSYIFQFGRCKNCKTKIPVIHPIYELISGILFVLCYLSFGLTPYLIIALTFVSLLLIIVVSDFLYMIISDEVLIFFGILLILEILMIFGVKELFSSIINGLIAFAFMFLVKIIGDYIFKKESMGGGDIKLLFFFGLCLGWEMAIFSIFLGSVVGFPISLIILSIKKNNIVPFGPFLSIGAIIILLTQLRFSELLALIS